MINASVDRRDTSIEVVGCRRGFCQTSLLILNRDDAAREFENQHGTEFYEWKSDMAVKFNPDVSHTSRRADSPLINTPLQRGVGGEVDFQTV